MDRDVLLSWINILKGIAVAEMRTVASFNNYQFECGHKVS